MSRRRWGQLTAFGLALFCIGCADDGSRRGETEAPRDAAGLLTPALAPAGGADSITQRELREIVEYLASEELEGRDTGQGGDELAAVFIADELGAAGLAPDEGRRRMLQPFRVEEARTFNVIARLAGTDPLLEEDTVVVGAHFDHLGVIDGTVHPGADDNASGTALLLEVAEAMALGESRRTVIFAAFGAEELGLIGSRRWVDERFEASLPIFMINADMVGHLATGRFAVYGVAADDVVARTIRDACARHDVREPRWIADPSAGSDHMAFAERGVPVAFFFTGLHTDYHTPRDRAETLDYAGLTALARVVYEATWALANSTDVSGLGVRSYGLQPEEPLLDHGVVPFADPAALRGHPRARP